MRDLIKKGQLKPDANFQELNNLLQNDPEYQSMLKQNAEQNKAGPGLSAEQLAAMDGITQRIEDGEDTFEYGEEGEEEEEEQEMDLAGLGDEDDEFDGSDDADDAPAAKGLPTLMSAEEYRAMKAQREQAQKKKQIPRPQPFVPRDGEEDNSANPLFQAMAKNAKK